MVNIGLEGMMILGTLGAGYFGYHYGAVAGRRSARSLFGVPSAALLHALATVIFGVDHIVSGVAINIIAAGRRRRSSPRPWFSDLAGRRPDAVAAARRRRPTIDLLGHRRLRPTTLEDKHWFLVSDLAGVVRGADHEPLAR